MLQHNTEYQLALEHAGHRFYVPIETIGYSKWRELAMTGQDMFSRSGIDPDTLQAFAKQLLDKCNDGKGHATLRSDVAVIATNILVRLRNPIDELCAIRMGAIALIHEDEDPIKVSQAWIRKKMDIAQEHPTIFDFFLQTGVALTPEYSSLLRGLTAEDYLMNRAQLLQQTTPITP